MAGASCLPRDGGPSATAGFLGALLGHPLGERWSGSVEAVALPGIENTPGQGYAGAALIWNPAWNVQLDLSADFGLDEDAADVIAALGLSCCW